MSIGLPPLFQLVILSEIMSNPIPNPFGDPEPSHFVLNADAFMASLLAENETDDEGHEPQLLSFDPGSLRIVDRRLQRRPRGMINTEDVTSVKRHETRNHLSNQGVSNRSY